eukprot:gnl/TRDRNA2_/TRDRNA2_198558_c0_seq1.p1 gnl/TRDRNA2_/TRDRNA2_198558_c0~~gnl/TRDRNA2_/TRDRNA2_198558_c0_seq1.p1  ORF type:complete len:326 (+),score=58.43 gnl/TRDRNA2_/TRDRNA2_198558_c0_seq1:26-979(+)
MAADAKLCQALPMRAPPMRISARGVSRAVLRLAAALANMGLAVYIYATYLLAMSWSPAPGPPQSRPPPLRHYLFASELDTAFEHLRTFTFSDAMLDNLGVFAAVGTPVAVLYLCLELDRIRWLQALVAARLPEVEARRASWWLEVYLWSAATCFIAVVLLVPLHLELPRLHYPCAGVALMAGSGAIGLYLAVPVNFQALAAADEDVGGGLLAAWAARVQHHVRPVLMFVLVLHAAALVSAVLKAEMLGDERFAQLFGLLETSVILGYQLFVAVFAVDDVLVGQLVPSASEGACDKLKVKLLAVNAPDVVANDKMMGS